MQTFLTDKLGAILDQSHSRNNANIISESEFQKLPVANWFCNIHYETHCMIYLMC